MTKLETEAPLVHVDSDTSSHDDTKHIVEEGHLKKARLTKCQHSIIRMQKELDTPSPFLLKKANSASLIQSNRSLQLENL